MLSLWLKIKIMPIDMEIRIILLSVFSLIVAFAGCNQSSSQTQIDVTEIIADTTFVNVFYFRIRQRCETCNAVAAVARNTVETAFANNEKVRYIEIENSQTVNYPLLEKFEVMWNALIIVKSDDATDITQRAFLNAVNNAQFVENIIIAEVNKRL